MSRSSARFSKALEALRRKMIRETEEFLERRSVPAVTNTLPLGTTTG